MTSGPTSSKTEEENMKVKYFPVLLLVSAWFSACGGSFQAGGYVQSGVQALLAGNNETALAYFQSAAQQDPTYMYGGIVSQGVGVLSFLGRAQYLTRNYAQARQTLEKALAQNKTDNLARLYLGLTQARLGDTQAGLQNIQASMKRIIALLNYLEGGGYEDAGWDPGGAIRGNINAALAMISSGNVEWNKLFVYGESVGLGVEQSEANFRQNFIDST
jgi:tetratricopeptide (TPR) repeat protein